MRILRRRPAECLALSTRLETSVTLSPTLLLTTKRTGLTDLMKQYSQHHDKNRPHAGDDIQRVLGLVEMANGGRVQLDA